MGKAKEKAAGEREQGKGSRLYQFALTVLRKSEQGS